MPSAIARCTVWIAADSEDKQRMVPNEKTDRGKLVLPNRR